MPAVRPLSHAWLWRALNWGIGALLLAALVTPLQAAPTAQSTTSIRISEIHAAPRAVKDLYGEWIELVNLGDAPVDLRNWSLLSEVSEIHQIKGSLMVAPGAYIVLARNGDPAQNGGVQPAYLYSGLDLGNLGDSLHLVSPEQAVVDSVTWGDGTPLQMADGASLERMGPEGAWVTAHSRWPGSAGDRGSPGAPYAPPPSPTPTVTPPPAVAPRLLLSEVMADPQAVADEQGEWLEIVNLEATALNLAGWQLSDLDHDQHTIAGDLWIAPGQYLVLARHGDPAQNGGVHAAYVYSGLTLANEADKLRLVAPWGAEVDRVVWGGAITAARGASLERTAADAAAGWVVAATPWPGSAGDCGSPGAPYTAPTPTPSPTPPAPPTATPTPLPVAWPPAAGAAPLQIDEVYYHTADQEYIVLRNAGAAPLDLGGWLVGDAAAPGSREGIVALPAGYLLDPGGLFVLARSAPGFQSEWGRAPHAEWSDGDPAVLTPARQTALASGEIALDDAGDEVILLDPAGRLADALAYGDGEGRGLGLAGHLICPARCSLQQLPGVPYPAVVDLRHRFLLAAPDPFNAAGLPAPQPQPAVMLDGGLLAQWGTLGATSTFSPGGMAPPHYLVAAAAALGLDFIAIADLELDPVARVAMVDPPPAQLIPAWRWQNPGGDSAIVYTRDTAALLSWADLLDFLAGAGAAAQTQTGPAPADTRLSVLAADQVTAPGGVDWLVQRWLAARLPLLPAGNANPPWPGYYPPAPRYTGLAVVEAGAHGIQDALRARRGWLTSSPGLWLTLRAGTGPWMGASLAPVNELTFEIAYGDRSGAPAGLALWQDGQIVRQLDQSPADGRWRVTLPLTPDSFLFAVATQLDGDFAVTAPLYVQPATGGTLRINEVLPAPAADHNGDGIVDTGDEFIELINPGTAPIALAGWQLSDSAGDAEGRRVQLEAGRAVGAGERLLLWRHDSGLSLNDDGDRVTLWDPGGAQVDSVAWDASAPKGASISRIPDGGGWQTGTPPTPGQANLPVPSAPPVEAPPPAPAQEDKEDDSPGGTLPPTYGQAAGPPASLAEAKLQGLEKGVEFRAQVVVPPGLFNNAVYVAEAARTLDGVTLPIAGLGIQVYLQGGEFMPLNEGDWVLVRGVLKSFRGELELRLDEPGRLWPIGPGTPLLPLPVQAGEIGESLEGRLVSLRGVVTGWQGDSIYLGDPADPGVPAVRVTVRSSLGWRRPYVQLGEQFEVVGIVSQFAQKAPWNGGYRILVRYESDLVRVK
ncbi:MAG: lamin tail domain-containing protein [Caldilineaceae bacterium]|nr:lamin tail domain-containing protein [Caldilineaceae bacterium]